MVIIGILLTVIFGIIILRLLNIRVNLLEKVALGYLIGIGILTLGMYYFSLANIKLTLFNIFLLLSIMTLGGYLILIILKKGKVKIKPIQDIFRIKKIKDIDRKELILISFIVFLILYNLVSSLYWPIFGWDSIALYDFRAKVFFQTGYIWEAINRGYFFGYPLMTSMAHTWVYLLGWSNPKFIYVLFYASLGVIFYSRVRKHNTNLSSLFFTFLVMISPAIFPHASFSYTNLPYMVYYFSGCVYLIAWFEERNNSLLFLSGLLVGLSTWVRSTEPFWVVNLLMVILVSIKYKKPSIFVLYSLPLFIVQQSWNLFLSSKISHISTKFQIINSLEVLSQGLNLTRFFQVSDFVIRKTAHSIGPYLALFLLTVGFFKAKGKSWKPLVVLVTGNLALLFVGSYIFSYAWPEWNMIGESLQRMIIVFIPLFVFTAAIRFRVEEIIGTTKKLKR